jgi:immune inhibitor A
MGLRSLRLLAVLPVAVWAVMGATADAAHHDAGSHSVSAAAVKLAQEVVRPLPIRNLYALTDELRLHSTRSLPHVAHTNAPTEPVGHQEKFNVLSEDNNNYFSLDATIHVETPHLYIYVQKGLKFDDAKAQASANFFEKHIYPTNHKFFGTEWTPGVDGDPHIICLYANLKSSSAAGFFSAEDEYTHAVNPYSNQHEMIYLNALYTEPGSVYFNQILSHEFQHMIHWNMHPHDNGWLNEGMSMVAEKLNGFPPSDESSSYLILPQTQLNSWSESGSETVSHYGAAYLFLSYLYNHYGSGVIHDMLTDGHLTDMELVNAVLKKHHIPLTANQVFARWAVANILRNPKVSGGIYDYANLSSRVTAASRSLPFATDVSAQPYAGQYTVLNKLSRHAPFTLQFTAPDTDRLIGVSRHAPFWWSNRGDMSDTRLERTVDLRHVRHATLSFDTWYDIEKDYDYAYAEASRNGGKTWHTLKATDTTSSNPYDASYGNGYTGQSNGWKHETVNLSPYTGSKIEIRFEYITDEIYNGQGMLLQNIAIPQIHWHDNFTGWTQQGFKEIPVNALPAQWHVRLVEYTSSGLHVRSLPVSIGANGQYSGSLRLNPTKSGLKKLDIVAFYTAPKTTVALQYHLSATDG